MIKADQFNAVEVHHLFQTLRCTTGTGDKLTLLEKALDSSEVRELFKLHAHPYIQFYITEVPSARPSYPSTEFARKDAKYTQFLSLTDQLSKRTLSGHAAQAAVWDFFATCDEAEADVFKTVLFRLPLNVAVGLLNKAFPNLIPKFQLMLADNKIAKIAEVRFPAEAQPKLDGFRAVHHPQQGFIGRNGQLVKNEQIHKVFSNLRSSGYVFDGELYSHELSFNEISSRLRSEDGDVCDIHFCVYDAMVQRDWDNRDCAHLYADRLAMAAEFVRAYRSPTLDIRLIDTATVRSASELEKFYAAQLEKGYEGAMIKDSNGRYQWKRVTLKSGIMSKLKPHSDYDGKIVGYEEGTNKNKGKLGALIVEVAGIANPVGVGTGFSQAQRSQFWAQREALLGQWIRFRATEVTEGGESLRFPRFGGIRDPK